MYNHLCIYTNCCYSVLSFHCPLSGAAIKYVCMYVILNGYVLSYARFDWLVGSVSVYQENLFLKKGKKQQFPSFVDFFFLRNISESNGELFSAFT